MDEKKIGNPNIKNHGKNTRFSKDNQPDPKLISDGHVKKRERKNLKRDMFELMFNKPLKVAGGADKNTLEEMVKLLLGGMFGAVENTKMSYKMRVELAMKVADFLGIKETLNQHMFGDGDEEVTGIDIQFIKSDQKKSKNSDYMTDKHKERANNAVSAVMKSLSLGGEIEIPKDNGDSAKKDGKTLLSEDKEL